MIFEVQQISFFLKNIHRVKNILNASSQLHLLVASKVPLGC